MYLLNITDTVKGVIDNVFDHMMAVGSPLESVAQVIAGLGCLIYVASIILPALERAEKIDIYPLLKPILVAFVVFNFSIVTGALNGFSDALGSAVSKMVQEDATSGRKLFGEKFKEASNEMFEAKEKEANLKEQAFEVAETAFAPENVAKAKKEGREVVTVNMGAAGNKEAVKEDLERSSQIYSDAYAAGKKASGFWEKAGLFVAYKVLLPALSWLAQFIGQIAYVIIILLAKFNMIVLAIVGPLSFGLSQFKILSGSFSQWLARFISVGLWPGLCGLVQGIINMVINALAAVPDTTLLQNIISGLIIIIVSSLYFYVPAIAGFVVQSGGMGGLGGGAKQAAGATGRAIKKAITKV